MSRPVSRAEMLFDPEAMQSMLNEWGGLYGEDTFDGSWIRERDEIVATSKAKKDLPECMVSVLRRTTSYQSQTRNVSSKVEVYCSVIK